MRSTEGISETPIPEYPTVYPSNDTQSQENPMINEFDRLTQSNEWELYPKKILSCRRIERCRCRW